MMRDSVVYFAQCRENGFIKIGCTASSVGARIYEIGGRRPLGEAATIEILGSLPGWQKLERTLHRTFRDAAAPWAYKPFGRECFRPTRLLLEFARALPWAEWQGEVLVFPAKRPRASRRCSQCHEVGHHMGACPRKAA